MKKLFGMLLAAGMGVAMTEMGNPGPRPSTIERDAQRRRERARYGYIDETDRARIIAAQEKQRNKQAKRQADRVRNGHA